MHADDIAMVEAALEAGALILDVYARQEVGARAKTDGSPVTEADGLAEAAILMRLAHAFPGIPVIAEEAVAAGQLPPIGRRFFLVDPLDGTREFLNRNGEFTVNIALVENGRPLAGVVYAPVTQHICFGRIGQGSQGADVIDGKPGMWRAITASAPASPLRVVASRSHLTAATRSVIEGLPNAEVSHVGSSLKFCRLASGDADFYPCLGPTSQWDTAAGEAVLTAAGGKVVQLDGTPLRYGISGADFLNPHFVAAGAFDPLPLL